MNLVLINKNEFLKQYPSLFKPIDSFYPIGISKELEDYFEYKGIIALNKIVNRENYNQKWI